MTIIIESLRDIAAVPDTAPVVFYTEEIRDTVPSGSITTTRRHSYIPDGSGVVMTESLDPGPAVVKIGPHEFRIMIPDSPEPVRLWPLIQASDPPPAGTVTTGFIANGGGVSRAQFVSLSEYSAMTKDPETVYLIHEGVL